MNARRIGFLLVLILWAPVAVAETAAAPDAANGRYSMTPTAGGFLRLDTKTGAVSLCTVDNGVPQCRAGPDERAAFEAEIQRLLQENVDLKAKITGTKSDQAKPNLNLPADEDVDRALGVMEKFMRRMMRIMREEMPGDHT